MEAQPGDAVAFLNDDGVEITGALEKFWWSPISKEQLAVVATGVPKLIWFVARSKVWSVLEVQERREAFEVVAGTPEPPQGDTGEMVASAVVA